ncbi:MAG: beta-ketoacyl-ACP synthase II [Eubacterium sp.]|jgi:3-oxoacyl-[acyl-carrier-protein] synthase II|nr:beta-ketoacyl-ACP synthase II [Eubacterium sp.]
MKERLVITGMGAVTPIGIGVETYWNNLIAGKCGVERITRFDPKESPVKIAAQVKNFNPDDFMTKKQSREMDLFMQYGYAAGEEALSDGGIKEDTIPADRMGVVVGTAMAGVSIIAETQDGLSTGEHKKVSPRFVPKFIGNIAAAQIAIAKGYRGPSLTVSTACSSGADAISTAAMLLLAGEADAILVVGAEASLCPVVVAGLASAHALSTNNDNPQTASRPFDKTRDGFVFGEGGGALLLETEAHALARGAKIHAELMGFANCTDGYHVTAPHPEGIGAIACMDNAIKKAGLTPEDIGYINTHGTSTPMGDTIETNAIKSLFGDHAYQMAVTSTKGATGHMMGAGGVTETIACIKAVQEGVIPPTMNLNTPDDECDLNYVPNKAEKRDVRYAMTNAFGFGGQNSSLIIGRYDASVS